MSPSLRFLRNLCELVAPEPAGWFRAWRQHKSFCRAFKFDQRVFKEAFYPGKLTPAVLTGPFCGMQYLDEIVWGPITPKWAGAYEMELQDIVAEIALAGYDRIINIGCAEGYYAVGLLFLDPNVEMFASDRDPIARRQTVRLARLNHVSDRLHVLRKCTIRDLDRLITGKALVLCDIEGGETVLINPVKAPNLRNADLLLEIHEHPRFENVGGVEALIRSRLLDSHGIERRVSSDPETWMKAHRSLWEDKVSADRMRKSLDEARSSMQVYLWARSRLQDD